MEITSINKVSIRYKSGGHSFSEKEIERINAEGRDLEISIITPKSVLLPVESYIYFNRSDYLVAMGLAPTPAESVVDSIRRYNMEAVMAVDKAFTDNLGKIKVNVWLTTPLLDTPIERGTVIELIEDVAYIRIYDDGLCFAEAVAINSDADLIYTLEHLNSIYGIYNMYARAKGDTERIVRICHKSFKNIEI